MSKRSLESLWKAEQTMALIVPLAIVFILSAILSYKEFKDYRDKKDRKIQIEIANILEKRWASNGYSPSIEELIVWEAWINLYDIQDRGLSFWTGFIEQESSGNPTARGDGGHSRGTGSVKRAMLEDHCYRTKRRLPKRADVALYNPLLNIKVMITEIEFLARQYQATVLDKPYGAIEDSAEFPLAWACLAYNSGPGKAAEMRRRGVKPRFTFYKKVRQREAEIETEIDNLNRGG